MTISVIILTFNAEGNIGDTLESALKVSDDVHVVDSHSTDRTVEIAKGLGAHVVEHAFETYGAQRNWAIENIECRYRWQLHIDADERLSGELVEELNALKPELDSGVDGYYVPRLVHFMNRPIRHGGMYPIWHLRLFRQGKGRCESRRYDQHFVVDGPTRKLRHPIIDDHRLSLSEWTARHLRWADAEVDEVLAANPARDIRPSFTGNPVERKRALRGTYYRLPPFVRPFLLFVYRYVFRLGFLDGREGLVFFVLQTFWFRFLVDAKLFERRLKGTVARHSP